MELRRKYAIDDKLIFAIVIVIFIITVFKDSFTSYPLYGTIQIRYIDDVFVVILYGLLVLDLLINKSYKNSQNILLYVLISLLVLNLIQYSDGINIARYNYFYLLRDNVWYIPIAYFVITAKNVNKYKQIIIIYIYLQLSAVLIQELYYIFTHGTLLFEDEVSGLIGLNGSHKLSYSLILCLPVAFERKKYFLIFGIMLAILLASARSAIVFYFLSLFIYFLFFSTGFRARVKNLIFISAMVFIIGFIYINYTKTTLNLNTVLTQQESKFTRNSGANRIAFTGYVLNKTIQDGSFLVGFGPGSFTSRSAKKIKGEKYREYLLDFPFRNEFISGGGEVNVWIGELGIIGFIIFVLFYSFILIKSIKFKWYFISLLTFFFGLFAQKLVEDYSNSLILFIIIGIILNYNQYKSIKTL